MSRVVPTPLGPFGHRRWRAWMDAMLAAVSDGPAGGGGLSAELVLLRDREVAKLNAAYLGCSGPTNILSFPAGSGRRRDRGADAGETEDFLGSLFLSVDALRRESLLYGQDQEEHARRLLAHGLAHLLGHDHGPAMDAACAAMLDASAGIA